jgi:diguanylate cyclase (GGDEF)-like protein
MHVSIKSGRSGSHVLRYRLVKALYASHKQSTLGILCHVIVSLIAYGSTGDPAYLYGMGAIIFVFALRTWDYNSFKSAKMPELGDEDAFSKRWQLRYLAGACSIALWMGLFGFYSVTVHNFEVPVYLAIGVAFGTLASTIGRNFGSKALTGLVLFFGVVPLGIAIFYVGYVESNIWYCSVAIVFFPFVLVAKTSAKEVYELVESNLNSRLEAEELSSTLDLALNHQPTGMMMINGEGKITRLNQTGRQLLKLPLADDEDDIVGAPLDHMLDKVKKRFSMSHEEFEPIRLKLRGLLVGLERTTKFTLPEGTHFEFRVNLLNDVDTTTPLSGAVVVFTDITAQVESERIMSSLANLDALTQTSNRRHWNILVEAAALKLRKGERLAICVLDINHLKIINDTLGQVVGDAAIKQIAEKLQDIRDFEMILGRYGGDEFVIAIPNIKSTDDIAVMFDLIFNKVNGPYIVHGHTMDITLSGGVYVFKDERFALTEAFSRADHALRKVKRMPTRAWTEFTRSMEMEYQRTVQIKAALREDISANSIKMMYQPMYLPDGSAFDCCEALARWDHPDLGHVNPSEFIDIAEELGVIHSVTQAILLKACRDCATWPGETTVSVNFSTLDIAHPDVLPMVRGCLAETGLDPKRLQIEVTETVFVNDFHNMSRTLKALQQLGIKIALDDFGTGYSALSYLTKLNFNKVKIDRSFVINLATDRQSQLLFNGIVALSKSMQFDVVVEGIETREQLAAVTASGDVDRIQGYIFSRPQTSADIIERLTDRDPPPTPSTLITFDKFKSGRKAG